jgi:hypothetical protein
MKGTTLWLLAIGLAISSRGGATAATPRTYTLFVPTSASIHGQAGAFFHTDLWAVNRSYTSALSVTATYFCFAGPCPAGFVTASLTLAARESKVVSDVVGTLFALPETAGTIALSYSSTAEDLAVTTRTYTPSLPSPTNGTAIPALTLADARARALFAGLGNNGGNLASGFRSNAGVFNPWDDAAHVTFTLLSSSGAALGTASADVPPHSAKQVNDIFNACGAGASVTANATLEVTAAMPVLHFVTVIDNQSGDSVFARAQEARIPSPATELLVNGNFDTTVGSWHSTPSLAMTWSPTDAAGLPTSGSALLTNTYPGASFGGTDVSQCVAVQAGTVLNLHARAFVSSAQANTGAVYLAADFSSTASCSSLDLATLYSPEVGFASETQDAWVDLAAVATVPPNAHSARVFFQVTKAEAGGSFTVSFDGLSAVVSSR